MAFLLLGWTPKQWALVAGWDGGELNNLDNAASMQARWQEHNLHEPTEVPVILTSQNEDLRKMNWDKAIHLFKEVKLAR